MDFRQTPRQEAFRAEASKWLDSELSGFRHADTGKGREEQSVWWQERLYKGGWAGVAWPSTHGGRGLDAVYDAIFSEEATRRDAPMPINIIGISLAGPTIMAHGAEAQKQRYLPHILSGAEVWCQGFSEPSSGSDLASLRTAAVKEGDGWRVNGQKIWTSWAHHAQKCLLLTRTDPEAAKHKGITCLLADTKDFDIRQITMINGDSEFNEMFLNDVYVSDEDRLGAVGGGWAAATTTLAHERSGAALMLQVMARQVLDAFIDAVHAKGLQNDSLVLDYLGRFDAEVRSLQVSAVRMVSALAAGLEPGPESSSVKLIWARTIQDTTRFALRHGLTDLLTGEGALAFWTSRYLRARAHSIEGGTDEVQKSIIAERVLGLPRSR
ncbi:MAG: acyl-CoA dehydrogenase family protein [Bordetella sp.]|nr:acyl-CoA dehydrogenase family protein [Bordetella sp.]